MQPCRCRRRQRILVALERRRDSLDRFDAVLATRIMVIFAEAELAAPREAGCARWVRILRQSAPAGEVLRPARKPSRLHHQLDRLARWRKGDPGQAVPLDAGTRGYARCHVGRMMLFPADSNEHRRNRRRDHPPGADSGHPCSLGFGCQEARFRRTWKPSPGIADIP